MKQALLTILLITSVASAQNYSVHNNYAPTQQDVVVLYDIADREFMPFFFYKLLGEFQDLKMHDSCKAIKVNTQTPSASVVCISAQNKESVVGTLSQVSGQIGYHRAYKIAWNGRAKLIQFVNPLRNTLSYSVVVNQ